MPESLDIKVLSPFYGDNESSSGLDVNDLSLVLNITFNDLVLLYAGDSTSKYWQKKIIPDLLDLKSFKNWAEADILIVSHHGSYNFFGSKREEVRDAKEEPVNYEALNRIKPKELIISAKSRFPLNGDSSGDLPPHYAAWKWYHKWFVDNREVKDTDKHPDEFKYTSDGNVRLEYNFIKKEWIWNNGWDHNQVTNSKSHSKISRPETKFG